MQIMWLRAGGFSAAVDAFARTESEVWFLSMLGNQQSVRALWARLVKGEQGSLCESELTGGLPCWLAREAWGTWRLHTARLPSGSAHQGILVPDAAAYASNRSEFLLLARNEVERVDLYYRFLNRRVDLPLHPAWANWLWDRGVSSGEISRLDSIGIEAHLCRPNPDALRQDLTQAVRRQMLPEPRNVTLLEKAS